MRLSGRSAGDSHGSPFGVVHAARSRVAAGSSVKLLAAYRDRMRSSRLPFWLATMM